MVFLPYLQSFTGEKRKNGLVDLFRILFKLYNLSLILFAKQREMHITFGMCFQILQ
ncbi:hypothetical protein IMSAGC004_01903 [Bacteroidaceae bacterium]|nr:hypothetical protein IMSAGC004_01903 [Bacteroidaceae bacterium]